MLEERRGLAFNQSWQLWKCFWADVAAEPCSETPLTLLTQVPAQTQALSSRVSRRENQREWKAQAWRKQEGEVGEELRAVTGVQATIG